MSLSSSKAGVFEIKLLLYSTRFLSMSTKILTEEQFIFDFDLADGQNVEIRNRNEGGEVL